MQTIDVHDLPEPVAKAIEAMVQSLRGTVPPNPTAEPQPSIGEILSPILQEAWALHRDASAVPLRGQESEVQRLVIEKLKRQGLRRGLNQ